VSRPPDPGLTIEVRPPELVEAAAGAQSTAESAAQIRAQLARRCYAAAFGAAAPAFARFVVSWEDELDRLGGEARALGAAVDSAAADYNRVDQRALGSGS
jgi:uncharacterized protein YukE